MRGQLKLVICSSARKLTITVLELKSLPPVFLICKTESSVFVKFSLYPERDLKRRFKTKATIVKPGLINLHETFSFDIVGRSPRTRLLISAWSKNDKSDRSSFIGCMSFGVASIVESKEVVQGWYYFLNESLGRKKHLAAKIKKGVKRPYDLRRNELREPSSFHENMKRFKKKKEENKTVDGEIQAQSEGNLSNTEPLSSLADFEGLKKKKRRLSRLSKSFKRRSTLLETDNSAANIGDEPSSSEATLKELVLARGSTSEKLNRKLVIPQKLRTAKTPRKRFRNELASHSSHLYGAEVNTARSKMLCGNLSNDKNDFFAKNNSCQAEGLETSTSSRYLNKKPDERLDIGGDCNENFSKPSSECAEANLAKPSFKVKVTAGLLENVPPKSRFSDRNILKRAFISPKRKKENPILRKLKHRIVSTPYAKECQNLQENNDAEVSTGSWENCQKRAGHSADIFDEDSTSSQSLMKSITSSSSSDKPLLDLKQSLSSEIWESNVFESSEEELANVQNNFEQKMAFQTSNKENCPPVSDALHSKSTETFENEASLFGTTSASSLLNSNLSAGTSSQERIQRRVGKITRSAKKQKTMPLVRQSNLLKRTTVDGIESSKATSKRRRSFLNAGKGYYNALRRKSVDMLSINATDPIPKMCEHCCFYGKPFAEVLRDEDGIARFRLFLESEHSDENLEFWVQCQTYKQAKASERLAISTNVQRLHLKARSSKEVNIDATTRRTAIEKLSELEEDALDEAQNQVFLLMQNDSFRRFQSTVCSRCKCSCNSSA